MNFDLFAKLADKDVPPVPADFDRQVHTRLNDSLLGVHVTEFLFQVVPYALWHFAQAAIGLVVLSLSGGFPHDRGNRPKHR
jgi:hypothetical protein